MKKKLLSILIVLTMAVVALPATAFATAKAASTQAEIGTVTKAEAITPDYSWYSTEQKQYTINSISQLAGLALITQGKAVDAEGKAITKATFAEKTVKLGADLTFADNQYWYVRNAENQEITNDCIYDFAGIFDGNGKTIYGLQIKAERGVSQVGLFRNIVSSGSVKNLTLDGIRVNLMDGNSSIGSIAGQFFGTATNCHVKNMTVVVGTNKERRGYIAQGGGLFGYISSASVENCSSTNIDMTFSGNDNTDRVGALIGQVSGTTDSRSTIKNCTVDGAKFTLTMKAKHFGAFVGQTAYVDVTDCSISGIDIFIDDYGYYTGGFVGNNGSGSVYTRCKVLGGKIVVGSTTSGSCVGGFAGYTSANPAVFTDCSVSDLSIEIECIPGLHGQAGGFIGRANNPVEVNNCTVSGSITTKGEGDLSASVGGFAGDIRADFEAIDCNASGMTIDATATNANAGGFVGRVNERNGEKKITLTECTGASSVSSNGAAGGLAGYMDFSSSVTFDNCVPTTDVVGTFANAVANTPDGKYEIDAEEEIQFTKSVCSGVTKGYDLGFFSIEEAMKAGVNNLTLLQDVTEDFTINSEAGETFILNLGEFTYNGTVTVKHDVKFTVNGTSTDNYIVLTEPFKDYHVFEGWCKCADLTAKDGFATPAEEGWVVEAGYTYHGHWTESAFDHLDEAVLHPDFGTMVYGDPLPAAKTIEFVYTGSEADVGIEEVISEKGYFDVSYQGLTLTIAPKQGLDVGLWEETVYVRTSDGSTQGVTATIAVQRAQAVIEVDTSDIVVVYGEEWQLPVASTNVGEVKTDMTFEEVNAVGIYTVTYSVAETANYTGDSKQVKVTVIMDPATVQKNLDQAVRNLNNALESKASTVELQAAIDALTQAYEAADTALEANLKQEIENALTGSLEEANNALTAAIEQVATDLANAKRELYSASDNGDSLLHEKIVGVDRAYKAADEVINGKLADLAAQDKKIQASVTALDKTLVETKKELKGAIDTVAANLEQAKKDLSEAIVKGDKELSDKIVALDEASKTAKALTDGKLADLVAEDVAIQASVAALENSLTSVKSELEAAIAQVQKNLDEAKEQLEQKDAQLAQKDEELNDKITVLIVILAIVGVISVGCAAMTVVGFVKKRKD